jgi:predicted extracellular nuclease
LFRNRSWHAVGLMAAVAVLVSALPAAATPSAESPTGGVVISQVYGGGGNTGATYKNDFVELFNAGTAAVSVTGWSVQYASATGTTWQTTVLAGSIPAGGYYLVQEAQGAGGTAALPTPDATGTIALSAAAGKVALVSTTAALSGACPAPGSVDFVGFGTTPNCFEGSGPTPAPSNTTAVLRSGGGCTDTDNNAADFTAGTPTPRNSAASPNACSTSTNPSGIGAAAPSTVVAGGSTLLTVAVTPGTNPTSTGVAVSGDLSFIGGSATQQLFDDGTHGDAVGGDNTFSFEATVDPATAPGAKTLPAAITDAESRSGSASIGLTVTSPSGPGPDDVVVSEVYGGGGNTGATYRNDFIELYNRTAAPISLAGWSVQYGAASGSTWQATALSGTIAAGGTYLVQEAQGAGGDLVLPGPDVSGNVSMAGGAGKVALLSSTTLLSGACPTGGAIIDVVGYGAANCSETAPVAALSNTTSAQRANGGATDTNNNAADFTIGAPSPRGTADPAPTVASSTPAGGAANVGLSGNLTINFSEPVSVAGSWFTIDCANSGSHTAAVTSNAGSYRFTLDPDTDFASVESCTVTIVASQVTDLDTFDPPDAMAANHVFSFTTADVSVCGDPATPIHTIQGNGAASPLAGSAETVEGVVVGDYQSTASEFGGFYLQEEDAQADADPATSEGLFVFDNGFGVDVHVGDVVRTRGTVSEFFGLTELGAVNMVQVCSTGASVTPASVSLPVASLSDLEPFEGMSVHFSQTLTATEVFNLGRFGEVSLSGAGRLFTPTAITTPGPAAIAQEDQNARSRIVLDDGNSLQDIDPTRYPQGGLSASNTLRVGDTLPGLTGVMDYRFSEYRIQPVGPIAFDHTNPRTPAPPPVGGNLKVASFNVLNFFNGDGLGGGFPTERGANTQFELDRQEAKEVSALTAIDADIVGLMEIENDAPPNSAIEELVAGLNAVLGAGTYAYIDTGVIGTDAIKVALIYKPAKVTPVGAYQIITSGTDPRFIDTKNRPSLAQTFERNASGARLTVVVNHLKSKGSDCNDVGDPDTGDGSGNCNVTRTNAAKALVDWLATDPTGSGDPDYLLIGDFNSYTFEDPIAWFTGHGYTNLIRRFGGLSAYSYVFDGESGYLDHGLASSSLADQATGAADWHINPDEPNVLDYNVEFKTPNQVSTFYDPGPYRASDHDPVVIGLNLESAPPTVDAGGPYTVAEGGSITVTASGNDPEGRALTYAWDLDNDGTFETSGQSATFSAAGLDGPSTRTIRVRTVDPDGLSDVAPATVTIQNVAPTASFNAPASTPAGFAFTLSLTSPSDPAPADTFTYAFDCGSGYGAFGPSASASCTPTDPGTVIVHGKIRDDDGGFTEYAATVEVTVTRDSLCALTRVYSSSSKVADKLCADLAKGQLSKFVKDVEKETGEALTPDEAATLIRLAGRL